MWLIKTSTIQLHYFNDNATPPYAILSHTWGDAEVSFQELKQVSERQEKKTVIDRVKHKVAVQRSSQVDITNTDEEVLTRSGYKKIVRTCQEARSRNLHWAWVDTCCIDKTSSAELSEAINSMYRYYQEADVCFAYLDDVSGTSLPFNWKDQDFERSRWFTRGWTLQELIAPKQIKFFAREWQSLGDASRLASTLGRVTGIPKEVILGDNPMNYSVAQRISWASSRRTTRAEDVAYCLLGLLEVNMALLYGEGDKAFIRLQEEIIKTYADDSIFAWTLPENEIDMTSKTYGVLADSPARFALCQNLQATHTTNSLYSLTNMGLSIQLTLSTVATSLGNIYATYLAGQRIFLKHLSGKQYARVDYLEGVNGHNDHMQGLDEDGASFTADILLAQRIVPSMIRDYSRAYGVVFRTRRYSIAWPEVHAFFDGLPKMHKALSKDGRPSARGSADILVPFPRPIRENNKSWASIAFADIVKEETEDDRTNSAILLETGIFVAPDDENEDEHGHSLWMRWTRQSTDEKPILRRDRRAAGSATYHSMSALKKYGLHDTVSRPVRWNVEDADDAQDSFGIIQVPSGVCWAMPTNRKRFEIDFGNYFSGVWLIRCHVELVKGRLFVIVDLENEPNEPIDF